MFEFGVGGGGEPAVLSATREALAAMATAHNSALFALRPDEENTLVDLLEQLQRKLSATRLNLYRRIDSNRRPGSGSTVDRIIDRTLAHPDWVSQRVRLADTLDGRLADTGSALGEGAISEDHAWVIHVTMSNLRKSLPASEYDRAQAMMLEWAQEMDPDALRQAGKALVQTLNRTDDNDDMLRAQRRNRYLNLRELDDGCVGLSGRLDPASAAIVGAALDPLAAPRPAEDGIPDPRTQGQRYADALTEVCDHAMTAGDLPDSGGTPTQVSLTLPLENLLGLAGHHPDCPRGRSEGDPDTHHREHNPHGDGHSPHGGGHSPHGDAGGHGGHGGRGSRARDGRPSRADCPICATLGLHLPPGITGTGLVLPPAICDRIACGDTFLRAVVMDPGYVPLTAGRGSRTIPAALRAAVIARDRICTFPQCRRPASWSQIHHIRHWKDGGEHSLQNCVLACSVHHDFVHYENWLVRVGDAGTVEWRPPLAWGDRPWRTNRIRTAHDPYAAYAAAAPA
jgi:hypothetical protein